MEKKNLDWGNLGFSYHVTDKRYVSMFQNGAWDDGALISDDKIVMSEDAGVLHYSQSVFEGLKAYETEDGHIVCFRPDLNASRMADSARRLEMPAFPEDRFVKAVIETVKEDYMFRIFTTPVGPYFKGGQKPIVVRISDFDRAAPRGTGHIKAGLNYAMSLHAIVDAHKKGFAENIYLDPATRTKIEETGGANILFVDRDGKLVIPTSDSILPSITRRSLHYVAEHYLGMTVVEREVTLQEVDDGNFVECGLCGTAAVISPIGKIYDHGKEILLESGMEDIGPVMKKLYDTLTGIQMGRIEAPEGWIQKIM